MFQQGLAWQGLNPPRCECHECTQARYRTSLQGQIGISGAFHAPPKFIADLVKQDDAKKEG